MPLIPRFSENLLQQDSIQTERTPGIEYGSVTVGKREGCKLRALQAGSAEFLLRDAAGCRFLAGTSGGTLLILDQSTFCSTPLSMTLHQVRGSPFWAEKKGRKQGSREGDQWMILSERVLVFHR